MAQDDWVKLSDIADSKLTPMLRQYIEAKAESGDSILFFRMGDFFEMFFEDALEVSQLLGLALTSRDGANKKQKIPMAGVPARSVDAYVARLIKAGRTVALCDQVEDPKEAKGIVKRAVVRTITPGTLLEPDLLEDLSNNYLASLLCVNGRAGLALVDISTGEFLTAQVDDDGERSLIDELTRMAPAEVLIAESTDRALVDRLRTRFEGMAFAERPDEEFDRSNAIDLICGQFDLSTVEGLGLSDASEALCCAGAILNYINETQRDGVPHLRMPRPYQPSGYVVLDGNTQRNLELVESMRDKGRRGTLIHVLDRTRTHMGARMLRRWILRPLLDTNEIQRRLGGVDEFFRITEMRLELAPPFEGMADLERLLGRLTSKVGNARDLRSLGQSIARIPAILAGLACVRSELLTELRDGMDDLADVGAWIDQAIQDQPPATMTEGNIFKDGYREELDRLRVLVKGGRDWIATLKREESESTGISNLKVGYNKVFGYYIEVSKGNTHRVPDHYERKQTLVNAERYITPALKEREEEIITAQERMEKLEFDLFVEFRSQVAAEANRIHETATVLATVDVLLCLAEVAVTKDYVRPEINESNNIQIIEGRHPVVEDLMSQGEFVPNDTIFDSDQAHMVIMTGPNMAGKSTYLRQVALITLMAQIGSFVPAKSAEIGAVDRIFTRVGASDNLVRGESTFMVEMIETAAILNSATVRSLIVLDEIGRGTSTFDGISIAWSVAEHIHEHIRAKTLFATHYHELIELANQLPHAKNVSVAVREWGGKVVFLYRVVDGGADHSYGIQVAKLAGLPREVIARARDILESLEAGNTAALGIPEQLNLFGSVQAPEPSRVENELRTLDVDALSPREAQEFLYHLRRLLGE